MSSEIQQPLQSKVDSAYTAKAGVRLKELTDFCTEEYAVEPVLVRLLVSCLIPCHPFRPIWVIVDTERHPFWEHLNLALSKLGGFGVQDLRPLHTSSTWGNRQIQEQVNAWLMTREEKARIFVDTTVFNANIRRKHLPIGHPYWAIVQECVQVRAEVPFAKLPNLNAEIELAQLLKLVIDPNRRLFPNRMQLPQKLIQVLKILNKLSHTFRINSTSYEGLSVLVPAHAAMCGRDYLVEEDWKLMGYIVRGWVPPKYHEMFQWYMQNYVKFSSKLVAGSGRTAHMPNANRLADRLNKQTPTVLNWLKFLTKIGLFTSYKYRMTKEKDWDLNKRFWQLGWRPTEDGEMLIRAMFEDGFQWVEEKEDLEVKSTWGLK